MNNEIVSKVGSLLKEVRSQKPLVHHLTNYVTVNDCANITLAIGASPIMADDIDEVEAITSISSALVLNIGTLNKRTVEAMLAAGKKANDLGIPVVLDPVGVGASELRNQTTAQLLKEVKVSVLRGNISEIRFVAGLEAVTKGVDASQADLESGVQSGVATAVNLAKKLGCVVAITGATDIISDGQGVICLENGHKMLSEITGAGCMSTSLVGSFCGVTSDYLMAAVAGVLCMGIAGEMAFKTAGHKGTGSFHMAIIDSVSKLDDQVVARMAKLYEK
jgi:hydroxyethylthiazole kinase